MMNVETVSLCDVPIDNRINRQYRTEIAVTKKNVGSMLDASDYGEFLSAHVDQLVIHRYLKREWPPELAQLARQLNLGRSVSAGSVREDHGLGRNDSDIEG